MYNNSVYSRPLPHGFGVLENISDASCYDIGYLVEFKMDS